jgi:hypothetical protein
MPPRVTTAMLRSAGRQEGARPTSVMAPIGAYRGGGSITQRHVMDPPVNATNDESDAVAKPVGEPLVDHVPTMGVPVSSPCRSKLDIAHRCPGAASARLIALR